VVHLGWHCVVEGGAKEGRAAASRSKQKGRGSRGWLGCATWRRRGRGPATHALKQGGLGSRQRRAFDGGGAVVGRAGCVSRGAARAWRGPDTRKWPVG
jgi:hypothetical protein